jgi:hypothetical protein
MSCHPLTVNQDFHALTVETIRLAKIQNVEARCLNYQVACFEKVPLGVAESVDIVLK